MHGGRKGLLQVVCPFHSPSCLGMRFVLCCSSPALTGMQGAHSCESAGSHSLKSIALLRSWANQLGGGNSRPGLLCKVRWRTYDFIWRSPTFMALQPSWRGKERGTDPCKAAAHPGPLLTRVELRARVHWPAAHVAHCRTGHGSVVSCSLWVGDPDLINTQQLPSVPLLVAQFSAGVEPPPFPSVF